MIFINARYKGEIRIFGIAIKDIEAGDVIWGNYGGDYWKYLKKLTGDDKDIQNYETPKEADNTATTQDVGSPESNSESTDPQT